MREPKLLIYGATGYTGRLAVAEAVRSGLRPVAAGRDPEKLAALASPGAAAHGLETRAFGLDDPAALAGALGDVSVVLHCAGPFSRTALPMYDTCLATGAHYLDITGEIDVFEALAARGAEAAGAGIMVLPGVGFDVVPSDCLIADLAARHPGGRTLRLGLAARSGASRGTMRTVAQAIGQFRIRRDGAIATVRPGQLRHAFDFGPPPDAALVGVLGDVTTAFHSTGIPNIETYLQATRSFTRLTRILRGFGPLLATRTGQALLNRLLDRGPEGPSESARRTAHAILVAEIEDAEGRRAAARVRTPDPYGFTATVAVAIASRALAGDVKAGYQTPSSAYGADLLREFDGVTWEVLDDERGLAERAQPEVAVGHRWRSL
ncbi:MAG: NAD(P)H-binding protein [Gemmatimonadales bacterium]|nr:NAD(P)H-binding protein [Gemmatimonadales bacterium]MYG48843.1 NAD(P)H-binding protein [Gemmatimonadales bacterium]MYK01251.1 NAD(P)H-binding protein [Candidatus Palauibacter ramosifaciens]